MKHKILRNVKLFEINHIIRLRATKTTKPSIIMCIIDVSDYHAKFDRICNNWFSNYNDCPSEGEVVELLNGK